MKKTDISSYVGYRQRLPVSIVIRSLQKMKKKFIAQELGRVQQERSNEKFLKVLEKEQLYGSSKGSNMLIFAREEFNKKVRKKLLN